MIGKTLAHYEIRALLGEGGMGQVYRALDTTLDREVALKLLPPRLADDPERLARLRREAKTLASIHHPRVATLFGIEEAEGFTFLTMELVEGPTLAEMLEAGNLRRDDAIAIALQIAEGLEDAHARGVIHRDLKPANIKVTPGDQVKILDFGLARAYAGDPMSGDDLANSPTITQAMTQAGVILGTAAYMSPEQAKGKNVDLRSDVWSFGVILYELLCGQKLFEGETVSETMAEVMKGDIEWDRLPSDTPPWLFALLERCLDRDPTTRLQSIGEARIALTNRGPDRVEASAHVAGDPRGRNWWPLATALALVALAVMWFGMREPAQEEPSLRFQLTNPYPANLRQGGGRHVAISPDGIRIATIGEINNDTAIFVRDLASFEWRPVAGTAEAQGPVFSPDGKWLAFLGSRTLSKVNLNGGAPIELIEAAGFIEAVSWADDGYIYGTFGGEFWRIPESGGTRQREVIYQVEAEITGSIGAPWVLPGGKALLYYTGGEGTDMSELHALDIEAGVSHSLGLSGTDPRFVAPDAIVFAQGSQVLAARFDPDRLEVTGTPVPVFDRVWIEESRMHFDVSLDGNVVYLPDLGDERPHLLLVDRKGVGERLVQSDLPFRSLSDPRLSPDGTRVAVSANRLQVWLVDIRTETPTLLSESGFYPLWTVDGRDLVYGSTRGRTFDLYRTPADLSRQEELILDRDQNLRSAEMAPDGTFVFREQIEGKGMDLRIWTDLDDTTTIAPLMEGPDDELAPAVSPDGKWMAYVSNLSGQDEVYVTTFPKTTSRVQASSGGGIGPAWSPDGRELYYTHGNAMVAARVDTESGFRVISREELFTGSYLQYRWQRQYDVTPDGEHFVMILNPPRSVLEIVTNWLPDLRRAIREED